MADLQRAACVSTNANLAVPQVAAVETNRVGVNSAPGRFCKTLFLSWIQFTNNGASVGLTLVMQRQNVSGGPLMGTTLMHSEATGAAPCGMLQMLVESSTDADTMVYSQTAQQGGAGGGSNIVQQAMAAFIIS
jgi:hypothetical protein